jgi:hypothetical protein
MKTLIFSLLVLTSSLVALIPAYARNVKLILPIAAAMQGDGAQDRPTGAVKIFLWISDIAEDFNQDWQLFR